MQYVEMTIEEAIKYSKGKSVLVAVQDLENNEISSFIKKNEYECEGIIKEAETIGRVYDDFINQLRVFTAKQIDIINFESRGKLSTILLRG